MKEKQRATNKLSEKEKNILEGFIKYLKLRGITSYDRYEGYVKEFLEYLSCLEIDYKLLRPNDIDDYRTACLTEQKGCARGTVNNKLTRIKSFYRYLIKKKIIYASPFQGYRGLKRGRIIPKNILSIEDIGKLLDNFSLKTDLDLMIYSMVELLYGSSLRISEVSNLKIEDLDFEREYVYVTNFKNNEERLRFPVSEVSLRAIKRYMKYVRDKIASDNDLKEGWLYPRQKHTTHRCLVNRKLKSECLRLGLKKISTHSFRHSSATHMLRKGAGIREVQAMLGHKRLSSTEIYTRVVKDDLKKVVKTFHPRELADD